MSGELVSASKLPIARRRPDSIGNLVGAFESETIAVFLQTSPRNEHVTVYVLSAMLTIAIVLLTVVKIDRVATSIYGQVMPLSGSIYVSPYNTSIVKKVNVKVGQIVKKGQSLATLDPTFTQADLLQLKDHIASDEAQIAREESELAGRPYQYSLSDPHQAVQAKMWQERQEQFRSTVFNYDSQVHSTEAQMSQAMSDVDKYTSRLKLASTAENLYVPLLDKGYVSQLQVIQATDTRTEMSRLLADAQNQVNQYHETINALKGQRDSFIQQWWAATSAQLVLDKNDWATTKDNLDKSQKLQDLTSLDAPEDSIVLQIGMLSAGSVAGGGGGSVQNTQNIQQAPMFTLQPLNAPVEVEIWIQTVDNSFIRVGDPVQLKLDAYSFIRHGLIDGIVKSVSEGSFSTDNNNIPTLPYVKVRVTIKQYHLRNVEPDFRLHAGDTLTGDILIGRRTLMSYIIEGAMRTGSEAMREPE